MQIRALAAVSSIALAALIIVKTSSGQTSRATDVRELQRLEAVWNTAQQRGDTVTLDRLWANDLEVAVPKMPVMTKAAALSFAQTGRMKFLRYESSDIRVRVYGDAAVVTGRLQRTRAMNGKQTSDDWRFTKTYIKEAGRWRVVSFHASEAAQP